MPDPASVVDIAGLHITAGSIGIMATGLIGAFTFWFKIKAEGRETRKEQAAARTLADQSLDNRLRPIEAAIATFKTRDELAEEKAALHREMDDLRHDFKNERGRVDALDHKRQETDRWAAKVDLTIANIEKGQERIERDVKDGFNRMEKLILAKSKPGDD